MDSLEERIIRLEAIEAIKQLKSHYALCADAKYTEDHERKPQEEIDLTVASAKSSCSNCNDSKSIHVRVGFDYKLWGAFMELQMDIIMK